MTNSIGSQVFHNGITVTRGFLYPSQTIMVYQSSFFSCNCKLTSRPKQCSHEEICFRQNVSSQLTAYSLWSMPIHLVADWYPGDYETNTNEIKGQFDVVRGQWSTVKGFSYGSSVKLPSLRAQPVRRIHVTELWLMIIPLFSCFRWSKQQWFGGTSWVCWLYQGIIENNINKRL